MKKFILLTSSLTLALMASLAISAGAPVTNIFQSGQPAIAADVNANFQELADRIDNLPTSVSYNYTDYIPSVSQTNVLDNTQYDGIALSCGAKLKFEYTHTTDNGQAVLTRTPILTDSTGTPCSTYSKNVQTLVKGSNSLNYTKSISTEIATGNTLSTTTYNQPRTPLMNNMKFGQSWGSSSVASTIGNGVTSTRIVIEQRTLAGIESVSVPYNGGTTYNNCLKIIINNHSLRTLQDSSFDTLKLDTADTHTRWYCPTVGLVKIMSLEKISELSDIQ